MARQAIGHDLKENRAALFFYDLSFSSIGVYDRKRVIAVHALGVQLVRRYARAEARGLLERHRFSAGLPAHAIVVIGNIENDRQSAAVIAVFPERVVLIHRGKVNAFPHGPTTHRAVAKICNNDPAFLVALFIKRRAGRRAGGGAHDGIVRINSKRGEKHMQGSAKAVSKAGILRENLAHHPVQEEFPRELTDADIGISVADNPILHTVVV